MNFDPAAEHDDPNGSHTDAPGLDEGETQHICDPAVHAAAFADADGHARLPLALGAGRVLCGHPESVPASEPESPPEFVAESLPESTGGPVSGFVAESLAASRGD